MSMMYCEAHDKQIDTDFDAEHFNDYDPRTGEHRTPAKASSTPTALSSIDEIRDILRQFRHDDHKVNLGLHTKKDADELLENFAQHLEAHIAEHYVPKAEVKGLDEILGTFDGYVEMSLRAKEPHIAQEIITDGIAQAKRQIEALIQDAVTRARIDEEEMAYFGWKEDYQEFEIWNDARIAELTKLLEKK